MGGIMSYYERITVGRTGLLDVLPMTKDHNAPAYLLTHFLILDSGNNKLNDEEYKVVAYAAGRFIDEFGIGYKRPSDRKNELLKAIEEVEIIEKIEPSIEELKSIKPGGFEDLAIRIYVKK